MSDTPLTDKLHAEGEGIYLDNGGCLTHEERDKLYTKAMALLASLERHANAMAEALSNITKASEDSYYADNPGLQDAADVARVVLAAWRTFEKENT